MGEVAIWVLVLLYPGLVVHELCHLVAAWLLGGTILEVRVWPAVDRGRISWGRVRYLLPAKYRRITALAPLAFEAPLLILGCTFGAVYDIVPLLSAGILAGLDVARNLLWYVAYKRGDLWVGVHS